MGWGEVMIVIMLFCGKNNECRLEKTACMQRAVDANPKGNNAVESVNQCLTDGNFLKAKSEKRK